MEQLSKLLMKERKYIQEVEQVEQEREKIVEQVFQNLNINHEEKTVTVILEHIERIDDKQKLEKAVTELLEVIIELRRSEKLNRDLIEQSMQFVQLSLDLLQPSDRNINYQKRDEKPISYQTICFRFQSIES